MVRKPFHLLREKLVLQLRRATRRVVGGARNRHARLGGRHGCGLCCRNHPWLLHDDFAASKKATWSSGAVSQCRGLVRFEIVIIS